MLEVATMGSPARRRAMGMFDSFFRDAQRQSNNPPARIKVFAPNGDTKTFVGWVGVRETGGPKGALELFYTEDTPEATVTVLNKKVVVQNLDTMEVLYSPRGMPPVLPNGVPFFPKCDLKWLQKNPHWPGILELEDEPVGEDSEGLNYES